MRSWVFGLGVLDTKAKAQDLRPKTSLVTMNIRQSCNSTFIESFLADQLSGDELTAFEAHLESCAACRQELESRVAEESWWRHARACLSPDRSGSVLSGLSGSDRAAGATGSWLGHSADSDETDSSLAAIKPYLAPSDDPRMLGRVGGYEVVGVVGSGGNGVVLKGFDAPLNRYVAIKLLSPRLADSGAARRRFSREAQAAAAVVHDNVMAIHAVSETQGLPYLVMPYVRGPSLEKRLRASGPLAVEEVLRVGMQVASGLAAAHAQGLVHRDIKPANILLEEGVERVKITDFGLARAIDDASLTRSGVIAGTPQYMSPEQARGEPVDHRTDLFSLGCVLYAACSGRSPFRAETSYAVLRKICDGDARDVRELNPAVPAWLWRVIDRLLAKDPGQRYGSAGDVAALLERCLAHVQQPATVALPAEIAEPARRRAWLRRNGPRAAVGVTAILFFVVALLAWRQRPPSRPAQGENTERVAGTVAGKPAEAVAWDDGISGQIDALAADVERLGQDSVDDLWNDSLAQQIDRLKNDVDVLAEQAADNAPTTPSPKPVQEGQR